MRNKAEPTKHNISRHLRMTEPSSWFTHFEKLLRPGATVLDVAAGGGRHAKFFAERGHKVTALDKNTDPLVPLVEQFAIEVIKADLEDGSPWPLPDRSFDAILVCNYLHRPLFETLLEHLAPKAILLYETFARGNEEYNRPRNPDHLLKSGELLDFVSGRLQVVAYRHGIIETGECPGVKQMICAVNNLHQSERGDGEPAPQTISY